MRGGIAERGGVRVGHRIIEINGQSVVATAHEKIVQALSNSVGEVKLMRAHKHTHTNSYGGQRHTNGRRCKCIANVSDFYYRCYFIICRQK